MRAVIAIGLFAIVLGLGVAGGIALISGTQSISLPGVDVGALDRPASEEDNPTLFEVHPGETAATIGNRLEAEGLITSAVTFRLLVKQYGVGRNLNAGEYELSPAMTMTNIISILNQGLVAETTITIPEGLRIEEIGERLEQLGLFGRGEFLAAAERLRGSPQASQIVGGGTSLEGYLLPDTYQVRPSTTPDEVVELLFTAFNSQFGSDLRQAVEDRGLTLHEAVTLASIVEREAVLSEERSIIASVFLNRIELGMALQADPTVQYAITDNPASVSEYGWWKTALTVADLNHPSAYNTYFVTGLPPGPIANPGIASLRAVAEPADTPFLYFVADGSGSGRHLFSSTLAEHNSNVARSRAK